MTKLLLSFLLTIFVLHAEVHSASITCKTSNELKSFKIRKKSVAFITYDDNSRSIASVKKVTSRRTRTGFTKTVRMEGKQHIFHINDQRNFSNLEDYYIVKNKQGHEVIYPLNCSTDQT